MATHDVPATLEERFRRLRAEPRFRVLTAPGAPRRPDEERRSVALTVAAACALVSAAVLWVFCLLFTILSVTRVLLRFTVVGAIVLVVCGALVLIAMRVMRWAWSHLAVPLPRVHRSDPRLVPTAACVVAVERRPFRRALVEMALEGGSRVHRLAPARLADGLAAGDLGVAWYVPDRLVDFVVLLREPVADT